MIARKPGESNPPSAETPILHLSGSPYRQAQNFRDWLVRIAEQTPDSCRCCDDPIPATHLTPRRCDVALNALPKTAPDELRRFLRSVADLLRREGAAGIADEIFPGFAGFFASIDAKRLGKTKAEAEKASKRAWSKACRQVAKGGAA